MSSNKINFQTTLSGIKRRAWRCGASKIYLETPDGIAVGVSWSQLNSKEIDLVMLQTIGKDQMKAYSNAWARLLAIASD